MNIVDILDHHAARRANAAALVTPKAVINYAELAERLRRMAHALRQHGIVPGSRVGLRLTPSPSFMLCVLALARLGAVSVPIHSRRPADSAQALARRLGLAAVLGTGAAQAIPGTPFIEVDSSLLAAIDSRARAEPNAAGGADLFMISFSSGTTGEPKAIGCSHQRMLRQWEQQQKLRPGGPGARVLVMTGLDAAVGLRNSLRTLLSGGTLVMMPDASLHSMAAAIDALGVNHVLASPALMDRVCESLVDEQPRFPDLPGLRLAGSAVSPALLARIKRRLCANVFVDYGASEVGGIADCTPELLARVPGSVGYVAPWVQVQAVDAEGQPLPVGSTGILRMRSDSFPTAYVDDDEASARVFRDGWFYPGDQGHVTPDGMLVVEARVDDVINLGGTKVNPAEVEQVLLLDDGIVDAAAYAVAGAAGQPPVLVAAVVVKGRLDVALTLARCRAALGQKAPQHLVQVECLPRNEGGKLMRRELAARTRLAREVAKA